MPDLYFPLVVFYSFLTDFKRNTIANWFAGLSKDLFSEGHFWIKFRILCCCRFSPLVYQGNTI